MLDMLETGEPKTDSHLDYADSLKKEIERSLGSLTDRQAEVLKLFFGIGTEYPLSIDEIGDKFGLTRERARQIKEKAINRLRTESRIKLLRVFLGQ